MDRKFSRFTVWALGTAQTGNLMQAARSFAKKAQQSSAGTAHTVDEWAEVQNLWQAAIDRLEKVDDKAPDYNKAQDLLAAYQTRLGNARIGSKQEQASVQAYSVQAYEVAKQLRDELFDSISSNAKALNPAQAKQLHRIVDTLKAVKPGTTSYADAQVMLKAAEARLK